MAIIVIVTAVTAVLATRGDSDPDSPDPSPDLTAGDGCNAVDVDYIDLNSQISEPPARVCFTIDTESRVTIGAASLDPDTPITLTVSTGDATVIDSAATTATADPEITATLPAGDYLIAVTAVADSAVPAPPFILVTESAPASTPAASPAPDASALPTPADCGDTIPLLANGVSVMVDSTQPYACLEQPQQSFVKVGADSSADPQASADLRLAVLTTDGSGTVLATTDDTFGTDPEVNTALDAGTYVVELAAWDSAAFTAVQVYYDNSGTFIRQGEPSTSHADLSPSVCEAVPTIEVGATMTADEDEPYICVTVGSAARLTIEAATLDGQDLTLEVLGFDDSGSPYRIAWTDSNPYATGLADFDPLLDQIVPDGTWVIAVADVAGIPGHHYDLRVIDSQQ